MRTRTGARAHLKSSRFLLAWGAVLALAIGLLGTWQLHGTRTPSGPSGAASSAATPSTPGTEQKAPAPPTVRWRDFAGLPLPVSTVHGPGCGRGSGAGCFTRDDAGAALAAVHLLVRTFPFAGPDVFTPTIRDRVVGRGRDQLAREVAASYISSAREQGVGDGDPLPLGGTGAVAGFRVFPTVTASGEVRRVGVLFRAVGEGGALTFTEYTLRLVWQDGDWRLTAPDWGDWRSAARVVEHPDPAAYTSYDDVDTVAASTKGAA